MPFPCWCTGSFVWCSWPNWGTSGVTRLWRAGVQTHGVRSTVFYCCLLWFYSNTMLHFLQVRARSRPVIWNAAWKAQHSLHPTWEWCIVWSMQCRGRLSRLGVRFAYTSVETKNTVFGTMQKQKHATKKNIQNSCVDCQLGDGYSRQYLWKRWDIWHKYWTKIYHICLQDCNSGHEICLTSCLARFAYTFDIFEP